MEQLEKLLLQLRADMDRSQDQLREEVVRLTETADFGEVGKAVALLGEVAASVGQVKEKINAATAAAGSARPARAAVAAADDQSGHSIADFRRMVLEVLSSCGEGGASPGALTRLIEERYGERFTEEDLKPLPSRPNTLRWRHYLSMAVTRCREAGELARNEDGHWTLVRAHEQATKQPGA